MRDLSNEYVPMTGKDIAVIFKECLWDKLPLIQQEKLLPETWLCRLFHYLLMTMELLVFYLYMH